MQQFIFNDPIKNTSLYSLVAIDRHPLIVSPEKSLVTTIALMSQTFPQSCWVNTGENFHQWTEKDTPSNYVLVQDENTLVGLLTERDFVRLAAKEIDLRRITVGEVMTQNLIVLKPSDLQNPLNVLQIFRQYRIRHIPVVNHKHEILGVVTPESLRQSLQPNHLLQKRQIQDVMMRKVVGETPRSSLLKIAQRMLEERVSSVVIVESQPTESHVLKPIGIITERDLVQFQGLQLNFTQIAAEVVMSTPLFIMQPEVDLWTASCQMQEKRVKHLVITGNHDELLGIVTQTNLLQVLDPLEMSEVMTNLQGQVYQLQEEKLKLLENRTLELEREVEQRTSQISRELLIHDQMEIALGQSEEKYQRMVETALEGICMVDREGKIYYTNQRLADLLGYSLSELMGKSFLSLVKSPSSYAINEALNQTQSCQLYRQDGSYLWGLCSSSVLLNEQGQNMGILMMITDITERKKVEEALQWSEIRWRSFVKSSPSFICTMNREGKILFANRGLHDLSLDEIIGQTCYNIFSPEFQDIQKGAIQTVFTTGKTCTFKVSCQLFSADRSYYKCQVAPIKHRGKVIEAMIIATDVTDVMEAKEALYQSEERYRRIIETAAEGIWEIDLNYQITFVNDQMAKMLGYTVEEMLGKPIVRFCSEVRAMILQLEKQAEQGKKITRDFSLKTKKGKSLWVMISISPFFDQEGIYQGFLGMVSNITQRKNAELRLQESERRYATLAEASPVGIFRTDLDGSCTYINQHCCEIFGLDICEALTFNWLSQWHPEDREKLFKEWNSTINNGVPFVSEFRFKRSDHSIRWVFEQVVPERDQKGKVVGYIGTITDITHRKSLEIALQTSEAKLQDIINNVHAAIYSFNFYPDQTWQYDYFSPNHLDIFGYTAEEFLQDPNLWISRIYPEDLERVTFANFQEIMKERNVNIEYRFIHKDNSVHWIFSSITSRFVPQKHYWIVTAFCTDITARKATEEALKESQRRLSLALEAAEAGSWERDLDTHQVFWSDEYYRLLGYEPGSCQPSYQNWRERIHPDDLKSTEDTLNCILQSRPHDGENHLEDHPKQFNLEFRIKLPDGEIRWLNDMGQVICDHQGNPKKIIGIQLDITERKNAQEKIAFQASLLSQVRHAVVATDLNGKIIYWNPYAEQMYQWNGEEVIGKTILEVMIPPANHAQTRQIIKNIMNRGHWEGELTVCRKDYSQFPVHLVQVLLSDTQGHPIGYVGVSIDISERKKTELALQESEIRNRRILDAFPDFVFRMKGDGTLLDIRVPKEDFSLSLPESLTGKKIGDIFSIEQTQQWMSYIQKTLQTGETQVYEYPTHQGEQIHYYESRMAVMGEDEVLSLVRDISDRKQAEKAQQQLQEELEIRVQQRTQELELQKFAIDRAAIVAITNINGIITYVSEKFCELSKYSQQELIGQTHRLLNSGHHSHDFFKELWLTISQGNVWQGEIKNKAKDGSFYWVDTTIVPFTNERGKTFQYLAIRIDITQRKQTEDALRESEQRFRMMADTAPVMIWMSGLNKEYYFFNQTWLNFTGRTLEQEMKEGWLEGVHPDDCQEGLEVYSYAFELRESFNMEYRLRRFDGEYRWVLNTGIPRFTGKQEFIGYIGSCIDITERKHAEISLYQQIERERVMTAITQRIRESLDLDFILNTTVAEVQQLLATDRTLVLRFLEDKSGCVIAEAVSPCSCSLLNQTFPPLPEKIYNRYLQGEIYAISGKKERKLLLALVDSMIEVKVTAKLVLPLIQQDKLWGLLVVHQCYQPREWKPWEIDLLQKLAAQLSIGIQQSQLYQQLQVELTERKQAEDNLKKSLNEKEILLKEIHHRVKNNLHVVSSLLQLQSETIGDPKIAKMFDESENRIHSMALIHEKLYRSQNLAKINFSDYLEDLVTNLFESYNVNHDHIKLQFLSETIFLNLETATPCGLIVNELVSNTLKHAFPDHQIGQVVLECYQDENKRIHLKIQDNGVGFPSDLDFHNTGSMGFQVVCTLIKQLKGTIDLVRDQGTTFYLNFAELNYRRRV